uniref:Uncharacterized protein n=1 Tax=Anopheles arabiensis TaxID=7173 RepID=A0A182IF32_ANOAR
MNENFDRQIGMVCLQLDWFVYNLSGLQSCNGVVFGVKYCKF